MSPDRRNRLILVVIGTLAAAAALYSVGISWFQAQIDLETANALAIRRKLDQQQALSRQAGQMGGETEQRTTLLAQLHQRMPSGDVYYSLLARLELLGRAHGIRDLKLVRPTLSAQGVPADLAQLGYVGIRSGLDAMGDYVQIGTFVAAFENELPFMRITELRLDVLGASVLMEDEGAGQLGFRMTFEGCATAEAVLQ